MARYDQGLDRLRTALPALLLVGVQRVAVLEQLTTHHLSVPVTSSTPVRTAMHTITSAECAVVEIESSGHVGLGYAMTFSERQTAAVRLVIEDLATLLVGVPVEPRGLRDKMLRALDYSGRTGIGLAAVSAIDTALWDLLAKTAGLPLWRHLGGGRSSLPVYVSCGFLSQSPQEIADEVAAGSANGLTRFKIKVGHADWRADVRRLGDIRALAPAGTEFYADANQAWTVGEAIAAGRALQDVGLSWLEDPVSADDLTGLAKVTNALDLAVVSGESAYLMQGLMDLLDRRSCDVLMPDIMRCGGPSGVLDVAAVARARHVQVASHAFTEIYGHVLATTPGARVLEYFPGWFEQLYTEPFTVVDGNLHLSESPGLGLDLSPEAVSRFGVGPRRRVELAGSRPPRTFEVTSS